MKNIIVTIVSALVLCVVSGVASASGFECVSADPHDGITARLYNHVAPEDGTRTPAVLVLSEEHQGTLLVRKGGEIEKRIRANSVQYLVDGARALDADQLILQIGFREGREVLEPGEAVNGQLILIKDSDRSVSNLICRRYLKQE